MQHIIEKGGAIHSKWMTVLLWYRAILKKMLFAINHKSLQDGKVVPGVVVSGTGATMVVVCAVDGIVVVV